MAVNKTHVAAAVDLGALLDAVDDAVVILEAGETRLAAHRAVLSARSPVFAAMFQHDMLEASSGVVSVADVEGAVMRQLLSYLYTLQVPQLPAMAPHLLVAADKYDLPALKDACERQVAAQLDVDNAAASALLAVRHSCPTLTAAAVAFVKAHAFQVMATQGWTEAMKNQTDDIIEINRLLADPPAKTKSLSGEERGRRLVQAAKEGSLEEVRAALAAGADVGLRDGCGSTALHWAALGGHVEVARCLAEAGAEVDSRDDWQCTPLHRAAYCGCTAVVRLLLGHSAHCNARNKWGWTPLHWAALQGEAEAAAALLEAACDREARDDDGKTPLDLARQRNQQTVVNLLFI